MKGEREAFLDRALTKYERAYRDNVIGAVADAIDLCHRFHVPPPSWVRDAVVTLSAIAAPHVPVGRKRGRTANAASAYRQNMDRYTCWDMVCRVRKEQDAYRGATPSERAGWLNPGRTLNAAFGIAANYLHVSVRTVRHSYRLVARDLRLGSGPTYLITAAWSMDQPSRNLKEAVDRYWANATETGLIVRQEPRAAPKRRTERDKK